MLYLLINSQGEVIGSQELPPASSLTPYVTRNSIHTYADAETYAAQATEATGELHIATDAGDHVHPRYDVIKAPVVGDMVSRGFNGDYYPAGRIEQVSKSLRRVKTTTGDVFFRRGRTGLWVSQGTWSMIAGWHDRRNPEF